MIWCVGAMTGGFPNETPIPNIYIYDPLQDSWTQGPEIPVTRRRGSSGVIVYNDEIYLVSGIQNGHLSGWVTWVDKFNPQTNTWTQLADAPRARDHWQALLVGDKIYCMGGRRSGAQGTFGATVAEVDIYDIASNTWTTLAAANNIPTERAAGVVGTLGDEAIIAGGESGTQSAAHEETEALHSTANTWRTLAPMLDSRHGTSAIVNNGGIWVAAGSGNRGGGPELNTMEAFFFFGPRQPQGVAINSGLFAATPNPHGYGQVLLGNTATQGFTLSNTSGSQAVLITALNFTGDPDFTHNFPHTLPITLNPGQTLSFDIDFSPGAVGARSGALEVSYSSSATPLVLNLNGDGINLTALHRVNAAGPQYVTVAGDTFVADVFFSGGNTSSTGNAIAGTLDDILYQTERWGNPFSYAFPVPQSGLYEVRLHFAEIWGGGQSTGARVLNASIEGTNVLSNYDIFDDVGGYTAVIQTFQSIVTDGTLNLEFTGSVNNAKISAIEVYSAGSAPPSNLAANPNAVHFFSQQILQTSPPQALFLRNDGASSIDITAISISGADAAEFAHNFSGPVNVPGGDSIQVDITFSPNTVGLKSAQLDVTHNGGNNPLAVPLTGEAVDNSFSINASIVQNPTCPGDFDGEATVTVNNGTSPFTYLWTPSGATTATATGLGEGPNTVRVIDSNNDTLYATVNLTTNPVLTVMSACIDQGSGQGQASVQASGGNTPYSYLWSANAGSSINDSVFGLANGTYMVTVTDGNGCSVVDNILINGTTPSCDTCALPTGWTNQDIGTFTPAGDVCYDTPSGTFTVQAAGADIWGTADEFHYTWLPCNGDGEIIARVTGIQNTNAWAKAGVMIRETLDPNSTHAMMCKAFAQGVSFQRRTSTGGTSQHTTSGNGNLPVWVRLVRAGNTFTGYWGTDGVNWTQQHQQTIAMNSNAFVGLAVTSHNPGTLNTSTFDNVQIIRPAMQLVSTVTDLVCNGDNSGAIDLNVIGGTAPYTYAWSDGPTTQDRTGLAAGTYYVTVTDDAPSTAIDTIVVNEPAALTLNVTGVDPSCGGAGDGSATATAGAGTSPYNYLWSDGQTTATAINLNAGTYGVTVTDDKGCTITGSVTLIDPSGMSVSFSTSSFNCGFNVSCNGANDGSATATASGGLAPYTYNWGGGSSTIERVNCGGPLFTAGNSDVFAADQFFTTPSNTYTNNAIPNILGTTDDALYRTERYGNMSYNVPVTNGDYQVVLHFAEIYHGATGGSAAGGVGDRIFNVDVEGVSFLSNYDIFADVGAETAVIKTTTVTVNDGVLNIDFSTVVDNAKINGIEVVALGSANPTLNNLTAGTYVVMVTDNNGCSVTDSVTLTEPNALVASTSGTPETCGNDGSATAAVSGGCAPYSYLWSDGQTTSTASNLAAGSFGITVTDANGCIATDNYTVAGGAAMTASATVDNNVSCNGFSDGQATASPSGGIAPYTYLWSDGQTTATASGLAAGSYGVTITDNNGCTASASASITEPAALTASVTGNDPSCAGDAVGTATATAGGGTAPYSYLWSDGQTTATAIGLAAGTYSVTVTDGNSCTASGNITLVDPPALSISFATSSFNCGFNISCNGASDGSATATASGGTAPYTYAWGGGSVERINAGGAAFTATNSDVFAADQFFTTPSSVYTNNAIPNILNTTDDALYRTERFGNMSYNVPVANGAYQVTLHFAEIFFGATGGGNGGVGSRIFNVDVEGSAFLTNYDIFAEVGAETATQKTLTVNVTDGVLDIDFSSVVNNAKINAIEVVGLGSGPTLSNLPAGTYVIKVTDGSGCAVTDSVTLTEPDPLAVTTSGTPEACGNDGSATATMAGGCAPYTYTWDAGTGNQTTATAVNLVAGTYSVSITDANGCTTSGAYTVTGAPALSLTASVDNNVTCNGGNDGQATATVAGGTAPYTFLWSNGQTTATATALAAGNHSVTVTDGNSCTATASVSITEPSAIVLSLSGSNPACFGDTDGSASATVNGGNPAYSYLWSDGQTTAIASNLAAGSYSVTVTDQNGCTAIDNLTLTQPSAITVSLVPVTYGCGANVSCNGGSDGGITAVASGGNGPYTYTWSNAVAIRVNSAGPQFTTGSGDLFLADQFFNQTSGNTSSTNQPIAGTTDDALYQTERWGNMSYNVPVSNGNYQVILHFAEIWTGGQSAGVRVFGVDIEGNPVLTNYDIFADVGGYTAVQHTFAANVTDGSLDIDLIPGVNNPKISAIEVISIASPPQNIGGLSAGLYCVTVTDNNGCQDSACITLTEPAPLVVSANVGTAISCNGDANGTATATASGGCGPYSYQWDANAGNQTGSTATGLAAGTYSVTITDNNGCTNTANVTLSEPTAVSASASETNAISTPGGNDGEATATASGGTPPYTYLWSDGQTTATATGLVQGTYSVTITDANGCQSTATVTLLDPNAPLSVTTAQSASISCNSGNDGEIAATAIGGVFPYTYLWSNGQTTATATGLAAGTYTVTVTDNNGSTATSSTTLTDPTAIVSSTSVSSFNCGFNISCNGANDGTISVNSSGGTPGYSYLWSNAAGTRINCGGPAYTSTVGAVYLADQLFSTPSNTYTNNTVTDIAGTVDDQLYRTERWFSNLSYDIPVSNGDYMVVLHFAELYHGVPGGNVNNGIGDRIMDVSIEGLSQESNLDLVAVAGPATAYISTTIATVSDGVLDIDFSATVDNGKINGIEVIPVSASTPNLINLGPGSYSVVTIDDNGCAVTDTVPLTEPTLLTTSTASTPASCGGFADGTASVTASGGCAPYTYLWSNSQTVANLNGLGGGTYYVTVTDANGCTSIDSAEVTSPSPLVVNFTVVHNVTCFGFTDGDATASASGGTPPYAYQWAANAGNQTTPTASTLAAGNYCVTVTDGAGCTVTNCVSISQPSQIVAAVQVVNNVSCSADLMAVPQQPSPSVAHHLTPVSGEQAPTTKWAHLQPTCHLEATRSPLPISRAVSCRPLSVSPNQLH